MKRWQIRELTKLGGEGSGNVGHAGRPGHRGGSMPKGGAAPVLDIRPAVEIADDIETAFKSGKPFHSGEWTKENRDRGSYYNLELDGVRYSVHGVTMSSYQTSGRLMVSGSSRVEYSMHLYVKNPSSTWSKEDSRGLWRKRFVGSSVPPEAMAKVEGKARKVFGIDIKWNSS